MPIWQSLRRVRKYLQDVFVKLVIIGAMIAVEDSKEHIRPAIAKYKVIENALNKFNLSVVKKIALKLLTQLNTVVAKVIHIVVIEVGFSVLYGDNTSGLFPIVPFVLIGCSDFMVSASLFNGVSNLSHHYFHMRP
jgi:hypothetical protein